MNLLNFQLIFCSKVTVFIGNLPFYYELKEIEELFAKFGEVNIASIPCTHAVHALNPADAYHYDLLDDLFSKVANVTLVRQPDGSSKGYAFVEMMEKSSGDKVVFSFVLIFNFRT